MKLTSLLGLLSNLPSVSLLNSLGRKLLLLLLLGVLLLNNLLRELL